MYVFIDLFESCDFRTKQSGTFSRVAAENKGLNVFFQLNFLIKPLIHVHRIIKFAP